MPDRRVPIAMKAKLKTELGDMVKRGIITPVEEPTPWVSQLVVTPKPNGRLCVCLDPKYLNKAPKQLKPYRHRESSKHE
ncbi:Reverse transcriptases (RTs) from retrotransposons domain-containing protein [Elysia marginata]|uniref:Reverse transcriptases (RTs) from retrotransposons domain-containing protein n=1 Tax=Elysia marginata TaxID=1093978 RepID=A0AAV4ITI1_9GAST|nr:Reverse transcriptases (RTs) from retrotransposons domain-containing protein [Elysia marginata]